MNVPLPSKNTCEKFAYTFGFDLYGLWDADGLNLEMLKHRLFPGWDVPDERLITAVSVMYGNQAAEVIEHVILHDLHCAVVAARGGLN